MLWSHMYLSCWLLDFGSHFLQDIGLPAHIESSMVNGFSSTMMKKMNQSQVQPQSLNLLR